MIRALVRTAGLLLLLSFFVAFAAEVEVEQFDIVSCKLATDIVQDRVDGSLAGYMVIVLESKVYESLGGDQDLRPFIERATSEKGSSVVVILPLKADAGSAHGIIFDGIRPVGYLERQPNAPGQGEFTDLRSGFTLNDGPEELYFEAVELRADDGTPVPAYRILSAGPRPSG